MRRGPRAERPYRGIGVGLLVLVLAACSSEVSPPPGSRTPTSSRLAQVTPSNSANPASTECGQAVAVTQPTGRSGEALAVFSSSKGLSVYDVEGDSVAVLDESTAPNGLRPRFRTPGLVSFVRLREPSDEGHTFGQDSIFELDLESSQATEILRLPNSVMSFDWNHDGTLLAYQLRVEARRVRPVALCLFDTRNGATSLVRSLERPILTGTGQREETSVSWSPNDRYILAVDTAEQPSLFVTEVDGSDALTPLEGTFARWLSDERVFFQEVPNTNAPAAWSLLSITTGAMRRFGLPDGAYRAALSPTGDMIAYDDGDSEEPSVYVFDIDEARSRRLIRGYVGPVWLGPDLIAATAAGACPPGNFCPIPWVALDTTVAIDTSTGEHHQLTLETTLQEVHRYGVIDVVLPSATQ